MSKLLRTLIKEMLSEALPSQHPMFRSEDLTELGEKLTDKLETMGFSIVKTSTLFNDTCSFEIEKNKTYLVSITKKAKNYITEDSSIEYFRRDDPELSSFLKKIGNKNFSAKIAQGTVNQKSNNSYSSQEESDETDDTYYGSDKEIFKFKTNIEYCVAVYDKAKNGNVALREKQNFITSFGKSPVNDDDFDYFADDICDLVAQKINKFRDV